MQGKEKIIRDKSDMSFNQQKVEIEYSNTINEGNEQAVNFCEAHS